MRWSYEDCEPHAKISHEAATYEAWCAHNDYEPLSQQKLGAELTSLGFTKWKSCGLIRYRDLQLVA